MAEKLEYKSIPLEFKADAGKRLIKGYASIFGNVDGHGDLIEPGAFAESIAEKFDALPDGKSKIKALWLHGTPIGVPTVMKEDSRGLYVEAKISKTQTGDEALELISDNVVDEMSIGYIAKTITRIQDDERDESTPANLRRILHKVDLFEFSPVIWGSNDSTSVDAIKSVARVSQRLQPEEMTPEIIEHLTQIKSLVESLLSSRDTTPNGDSVSPSSDDVSSREESKAAHLYRAGASALDGLFATLNQ